uniref:Uncharacterized protein n=1 Tax=Timema genevievae TaxID=629358 RepID=A0A7R9JS88_TIMGE|nr:unnamed protein product [Timema genevievae]
MFRQQQEDEELIILYGYYQKLKHRSVVKRRKKRVLSRNLELKRNTMSHTVTILPELDVGDFRNYLRMNEDTYKDLLSIVSQRLTKQASWKRRKRLHGVESSRTIREYQTSLIFALPIHNHLAALQNDKAKRHVEKEFNKAARKKGDHRFGVFNTFPPPGTSWLTRRNSPNNLRLSNKSKSSVATKVTGTVKWFNVKSGYGFINSLLCRMLSCSRPSLSRAVLFSAFFVACCLVLGLLCHVLSCSRPSLSRAVLFPASMSRAALFPAFCVACPLVPGFLCRVPSSFRQPVLCSLVPNSLCRVFSSSQQPVTFSSSHQPVTFSSSHQPVTFSSSQQPASHII